jgi:hypothetical protein
MYRICGFDPAEGPPTYREIIARTHPGDAMGMDQSIQAAILAGAHIEGWHRLMLPDGSMKHIYYAGCPLACKDGQTKYVGTITDVTKQAMA